MQWEQQAALLDFAYELSRIKENMTHYADSVLDLLKNHFGYHNTLFLVSDTPLPILSRERPENGGADGMEILARQKYTVQYLNKMYIRMEDTQAAVRLSRRQRDQIFRLSYNTINQLPIALNDKSLIASTYLPEGDRGNPSLSQYMEQFGLSCFVLMRFYVDDILMGALYLFKTHEEKSFSPEEVECIQWISRYLDSSYRQAMAYANHLNRGDLLNGCQMHAPFGVIIFDSSLQILDVNNAGIEYCREIVESGLDNLQMAGNACPALGVQAQVEQIVCSLCDDIDALNMTQIKRCSTASATFELCISSFLHSTIHAELETYYFMYITRLTAQESVSFDELARRYNLTSREIDIIRLLEQGYNNMEIGKSLYISCNTVKAHMSSMFRKFNVSSRTALLHKIRKQGNQPKETPLKRVKSTGKTPEKSGKRAAN